MWSIRFTVTAEKALLDLDSAVQDRIAGKVDWLAEHFADIRPERLSGPLSHLNKLRVGDYRVIYKVVEQENTLYVVDVGHRSTIYDR